MKKITILFIILLSVGLIFTACNKDEDPAEDKDGIRVPKDVLINIPDGF